MNLATDIHVMLKSESTLYSTHTPISLHGMGVATHYSLYGLGIESRFDFLHQSKLALMPTQLLYSK